MPTLKPSDGAVTASSLNVRVGRQDKGAGLQGFIQRAMGFNTGIICGSPKRGNVSFVQHVTARTIYSVFHLIHPERQQYRTIKGMNHEGRRPIFWACFVSIMGYFGIQFKRGGSKGEVLKNLREPWRVLGKIGECWRLPLPTPRTGYSL